MPHSGGRSAQEGGGAAGFFLLPMIFFESASHVVSSGPDARIRTELTVLGPFFLRSTFSSLFQTNEIR